MLALALVLATAVGVRAADREGVALARASEAAMSGWRRQSLKNAHIAAHRGIWVFRQPAALAGIEPGVGDHVGRGEWLTAHVRNLPGMSPAALGQASAGRPTLSLALLLKTIAPLFALMLGFTLGRRDGRSGGIVPAVAAGASPRDLVAVRTAVAAAASWAVCTPALFLAAAMVGTADPLAFAAFAGLALLVQAIFAGLGVAAGALGATSRAAGALCLLLWGVAAIVDMRVASSVGGLLFPTSTHAYDVGVESEAQALMGGPGAEDRLFYANRARLQRRYGVADVTKVPVNADAITMNTAEAAGGRANAHQAALVRARFARQDRLAAALGLLSPLASFDAAAQTIAGTDRAAADRFADATEAHRLSLVVYLNRVLYRTTRTADYDTLVDRGALLAVPRFEQPPSTATRRLREAWPGFAGIVLWSIVAAAALLSAARRLGTARR